MNDNNSTDDLIAQLSADATPCNRFCTIKHSLLWVLVAVSYVTAAVYWLGFRNDLDTFLGETLKQIELMMAGLTGIIAAIAAIWLAIPDRKQSRWITIIPLVPFALLVSLVGYDFWQSGDIHKPLPFFPLKNLLLISLIALVPTALMIIILRRAATTKIYLTSIMAALAIGSIVYSGFCLVCSYEHPIQLLVNIILPIVVVCSVVMVAALKWIRW